jgi:hypothetical protein
MTGQGDNHHPALNIPTLLKELKNYDMYNIFSFYCINATSKRSGCMEIVYN